MNFNLTNNNSYTLYEVFNPINGRMYIGMTKDFKRRIAYHKSKLKNNLHECKEMQNDFNEKFEYRKLCIGSKEEIKEWEKIYTFFTFDQNYNKKLGTIPDKKTLEAAKVANKNRIWTIEQREKQRKLSSRVYDNTIYVLINEKTGEIDAGTKNYFRKEKNISSSPLSKIINFKKRFKSYKGWKPLFCKLN